MRFKNYIFLSFILLIAATLISGVSSADDDVMETSYPLISAYIYNFTQFTTWPDSAIKNQFNVCVLGQNPFGSALQPMQQKKVSGKTIAIRQYSRIESGLSACNVLFIANSESANLNAVLAELQKAPVLTVSDIKGFSDKGGMVEFKPEDGKIGIWINLSAVKDVTISISSKLLSLSHIQG